MLMGPDWNKLYATGKCLYFGVPFSDEQWEALNNAKNEDQKNDLVRKFREEYLKNVDTVTGKIKEEVKEEVIQEDPIPEVEPIPEESIEDVKPVKKTKKGK